MPRKQRKSIGVIGIVLLFFCVVWVSQGHAVVYAYLATIRDDGNNVREFGGAKYADAKVLAVLNKNEQVKVLQQQGTWCEIVMASGQHGWVHAACLVPVGNSGSPSSRETATDTERRDSQGTCLRGNCQNGTGLFEYSDHSRYEGAFINGLRHGSGTLTSIKGAVFVGSFIKDRLNGWFTLRFPDGSVYKGDVRDDAMSGYGVFTWASGDRYEGDWRADKRHGKGKMILASGQVTQGIWENGRFVGPDNASAPETKAGNKTTAQNTNTASHQTPEDNATGRLKNDAGKQDQQPIKNTSKIINEPQNLAVAFNRFYNFIKEDLFGLRFNKSMQENRLGGEVLSSVFLTSDGQVAYWGKHGVTQFAATQNDDGSMPRYRSLPAPGVSVAAGFLHTLILLQNGKIAAFGLNRDGQCGISPTDGTVALDEIPGIDHGVAVAAGATHTLALKSDGHVLAWGANDMGQLGLGKPSKWSPPREIPGIDDARAIACGHNVSLVLRDDGAVLQFGRFQDVFNLDWVSSDDTDFPTPCPVALPRNVKSLGAGGEYAVALADDGGVWIWGSAAWLTDVDLSPRPTGTKAVRVNGLPEIRQIAAGREHFLALATDGRVFSLGRNTVGQLGNFSTEESGSPVVVRLPGRAKTIGAGLDDGFALLTDSQVWAWGSNDGGQLGNGARLNALLPVRVRLTGGGVESTSAFDPLFMKSDVAMLCPGENASYFVKKDGTVLGWGSNENGLLGIGNTQDVDFGKVVFQGFVKTLRTEDKQIYFLDDQGSLWTAGRDFCSGNTQNTPVLFDKNKGIVSFDSNETDIVEATNNNALKLFAVDTESIVHGSCRSRYVVSVPFAVKKIALGKSVMLLVDGKGQVYYLDRDDLKSKPASIQPVKIEAPEFIVDVRKFSQGLLLLDRSGKVYSLADEPRQAKQRARLHEQLREVPVLHDIAALDTGPDWAVALRNDGTVWTWGAASWETLGRKSAGNAASTPEPVAGLDHIVSIGAGGHSGLALRLDGTILGWGNNKKGQLGDGTFQSTTSPVVYNQSQAARLASFWTERLKVQEQERLARESAKKQEQAREAEERQAKERARDQFIASAGYRSRHQSIPFTGGFDDIYIRCPSEPRERRVILYSDNTCILDDNDSSPRKIRYNTTPDKERIISDLCSKPLERPTTCYMKDKHREDPGLLVLQSYCGYCSNNPTKILCCHENRDHSWGCIGGVGSTIGANSMEEAVARSCGCQ